MAALFCICGNQQLLNGGRYSSFVENDLNAWATSCPPYGAKVKQVYRGYKAISKAEHALNDSFRFFKAFQLC